MDRWLGILLSRPLGYRAALDWHSVTPNVRRIKFSPTTSRGLLGMLAAYVDGADNTYARVLKDGPPRFNELVRRLSAGEEIQTPVVGAVDADGVTLVDGNH